MGPDLPLFIAGIILIFCLIFSPLVGKCLVKVRLADESQPEVDEKLGNYWQCVKSEDRKSWMALELYNCTSLGIKTVGEGAMEKMRLYQS
jgi:hypothetical protein